MKNIKNLFKQSFKYAAVSVLAGAAVVYIANNSAAEPLDLTIKAPHYTIPYIEQIKSTDASPSMTKTSKETRNSEKWNLEGILNLENTKAENILISIKDRFGWQDGDFSNVFKVSNSEGTEKGNFSELDNLLAATMTLKWFKFGAVYLIENEKREFNPQMLGVSHYKSITNRNLQAVGPTAGIYYSNKKDDEREINFEADATYSYLPGKEIYTFKFDDKTLLGDIDFTRERNASISSLEGSISVGAVDGIGIKGKAKYTFNAIKQTSTTEKNMPVYENFTCSELTLGADIYLTIMKNFALEAGIENKNYNEKGTYTSSGNATTYYCGASICTSPGF